MQLRRIEERDLDVVRRLRNANRVWFFDSHEITEGEHRKWFEGLVGSATRFYVMEEAGRVVGTVSITPGRPAGDEIGNLIVDEAYRGRGFARAALSELTAEPGTYFSEVMDGNESSKQTFAYAGFARRRVVMVKQVANSE